MPEPQPKSPPRKRRWYQFSLRTLLIVMLLASVGLSWFAVKLQQARRQREAVAAIRKVGSVTYDYAANRDPFAFAMLEPPEPEPPGPHWLREMLGEDFFASVVEVVLYHAEDAASLKKLAAMPHVKRLTIVWSVTDEGLAHLPHLPQLEILDLSQNRITDKGLAHLSHLSQLKSLRLCRLPITDAGLEHLRTLHQLRELHLSRTKVTGEGVAELRKALPDCTIFWPEPDSLQFVSCSSPYSSRSAVMLPRAYAGAWEPGRKHHGGA